MIKKLTKNNKKGCLKILFTLIMPKCGYCGTEKIHCYQCDTDFCPRCSGFGDLCPRCDIW